MPIPDWPASERPREKLLQAGAAALSDAELLAVFLRVGVPGKSAVDVARDLIAAFGSLTGLLAASLPELSRVRGIGTAKYAQLQAVVELTRRALAEQLAMAPGLESPQAVRDYLRLSLAQRPYEVFLCLFLDARNRLLAAEELFRGTLTQTSVHPREVARQALAHNAAAVIVAHNHPSGNPAPSPADLAMTKTLAHSLALIDVHVLDHFIVAGNTTYSLAEHRQL
ncbi:DNA repair protein RadC [Cupriavidus gilardii]|uniref:RadC family protein n=1 Tax=Cupriavidus gilardii TaxID=82541 RepID=UPI001ABECC8D|nr:DNA repair protein RadC [Cupriavidus gilardii]MBO4121521.1 DNA repair protein RadC [Cupriavidus gilardii]